MAQLNLQSKINTGRVKPCKCGGRIVLEISDIGLNDFIGRYVVHCFGWHFGDHATGSADTIVGAVKDWCKKVGEDYESVIVNVLFNGDTESLPTGYQLAKW